MADLSTIRTQQVALTHEYDLAVRDLQFRSKLWLTIHNNSLADRSVTIAIQSSCVECHTYRDACGECEHFALEIRNGVFAEGDPDMVCEVTNLDRDGEFYIGEPDDFHKFLEQQNINSYERMLVENEITMTLYEIAYAVLDAWNGEVDSC